MGVRSKVAMLPEDVRTELERRIIARAFSGYQDLAEWLQAGGFGISEDSVQRYGFKLKQELEANRRAAYLVKAIAKQTSGSSETIIETSINLISRRLFSLILDTEKNGTEGPGALLASRR
jgi:hypothetical protein